MYCPRCGAQDYDEDEPCEFCGFTSRNKKRWSSKSILTSGVITLLVISCVYYYTQQDSGESDIMLQAAQKEMEKGIRILQEIENEMDSLRDVHHEIIDHAMKERQYASHSSDIVTSALPRLEEAAYSFERAEKFYRRCQSFHLSTQKKEYLSLELQRAAAYQEYGSTLTELCENYATYYQFSIPYLTGEQILITILSDMDRGNDHLEREDYTLAATAFASALRKLELLTEEYTQAYALLPLPYIDDFLSNLEHLDQALHNLAEAAQSLEEENVTYANFLAVQGMSEVQQFSQINQSAFQTQMTAWYQTHITALLQEKRTQLKNIRTIEEKISERTW
ncbi:MAG: hypothetical protein HXS47_07225 [Theionarchaea archaeon]|nr:hypothetical protein [Theionarchaea archaeon]